MESGHPVQLSEINACSISFLMTRFASMANVGFLTLRSGGFSPLPGRWYRWRCTDAALRTVVLAYYRGGVLCSEMQVSASLAHLRKLFLSPRNLHLSISFSIFQGAVTEVPSVSTTSSPNIILSTLREVASKGSTRPEYATTARPVPLMSITSSNPGCRKRVVCEVAKTLTYIIPLSPYWSTILR